MYIANWMFQPEWVLERFLNPKAYVLLLGMVNLCLVAFIIGYVIARHGRSHAKVPCWSKSSDNGGNLGWQAVHIEFVGVTLAAVAFLGLIVFVALSGGATLFYSQPHGSGGAWQETSAYLYKLPMFMFPAGLLLLAHRVSGGRLSPLGFVALWGTMAYLVLEAIVFGNRGDTIRLFFMAAIPLILLQTISRSLASIIMLAAVVVLGAVLVFPYLRDSLHFGSNTPIAQAVASLSGENYHDNVSGNELFFAAAAIYGGYQTEFVRFGYDWLYPIFNFIPRTLVPNKLEILAAWGFGIDYGSIVEKWGGYTLAVGSAPGGLTESFLQLSWAAPLAWLLLGFVGGRLRNGLDEGCSVIRAGYYFAYLSGLVYWATQGFGPLFDQFLYIGVPIAATGALGLLTGAAPPRYRRVTETWEEGWMTKKRLGRKLSAMGKPEARGGNG
jgi:hypothetical protein